MSTTAAFMLLKDAADLRPRTKFGLCHTTLKRVILVWITVGVDIRLMHLPE